jgi:hypothetical protein
MKHLLQLAQLPLLLLKNKRAFDCPGRRRRELFINHLPFLQLIIISISSSLLNIILIAAVQGSSALLGWPCSPQWSALHPELPGMYVNITFINFDRW